MKGATILAIFLFAITLNEVIAQNAVTPIYSLNDNLNIKVKIASIYIGLSPNGSIIGFGISEDCSICLDFKGHTKIIGVGSASYNIHGQIDKIEYQSTSYDLHDRINRIGL